MTTWRAVIGHLAARRQLGQLDVHAGADGGAQVGGAEGQHS